MKIKLFLLSLLFLPASVVLAQDEQPQEEDEDARFTIDTPVILDFDEEEPEVKKKKKPKKKVFYGIKTRKGFTRKGYGDRVTYELFYYLKKAEKPQTFVRDLFWYDFTRKEIRKTSPQSFDPKKGVLLHGPYKKTQSNVLLEEGIYYKGTRHGRWMTYNRDSTLSDKNKYFRGWPKESTVSYYDASERKRMKEITPIVYGEKDGYYYRFYENGQMAVVGEYSWDQKIGDWTEYYPNKKRKKIIAYPKEAFDKDVRPYVKAEWNEKGKEIYRKK
jgi:antitoxin component YwqK of YwqJK toxin-antitoxin module